MFSTQKKYLIISVFVLLGLGVSTLNAACPCLNGGNGGCLGGGHSGHTKPAMPPYDRPFPLGQVSDAFWETQQTNAEAADFILYDYEFVGDTATLNPLGRDHMTQIARRLLHVPFPIVIEMTEKTNDPKENQRLKVIDETRRANVVRWLQKFYADDPTVDPEEIVGRVVVAPDFEYQNQAERAIRDFNSAYNGTHNRGGRGGGYGGGYGR